MPCAGLLCSAKGLHLPFEFHAFSFSLWLIIWRAVVSFIRCATTGRVDSSPAIVSRLSVFVSCHTAGCAPMLSWDAYCLRLVLRRVSTPILLGITTSTDKILGYCDDFLSNNADFQTADFYFHRLRQFLNFGAFNMQTVLHAG